MRLEPVNHTAAIIVRSNLEHQRTLAAIRETDGVDATELHAAQPALNDPNWQPLSPLDKKELEQRRILFVGENEAETGNAVKIVAAQSVIPSIADPPAEVAEAEQASRQYLPGLDHHLPFKA
jgi:hypothetical protein